jgi:hypothetical protein
VKEFKDEIQKIQMKKESEEQIENKKKELFYANK